MWLMQLKIADSIKIYNYRIKDTKRFFQAIALIVMLISLLLGYIFSRLIVTFSGEYVTVIKYQNDMKSLELKHQKEVANLKNTIAYLEVRTNNQAKIYENKIINIQKVADDWKVKFNQLDTGYTSILRKYWYVYRDYTDISTIRISDLAHLDKTAKDEDFNPHIVISTWRLEAKWKMDEQNSKSSASGAGQFIASTGKYVYKQVLGRSGEYNHKKMSKDPELTADMTIAYIKDLLKDNNGDIEKALIAYNGNELGPIYYRIIDNYLKSIGKKQGIKKLTYM